MSSQPNLSELEKQFDAEIAKAVTLEQIEILQRTFLGRKGHLSSFLEKLGSLPSSERQKAGKEINAFKGKIESLLSQKKSEYEQKTFDETLKNKNEDPTLPSRPFLIGKSHLLTQVLEEITQIFLSMGFDVAEGPEIETVENNFTALNIPEDHPAQDMHDTFYVDPKILPGAHTGPAKLLLRTHTSPVQIRVMRRQKPPIRIIAPGKVFRHEAIDATHSSVFHQVEGLVVDRAISFADLKGTLASFTKNFFGEDVQTRFRPSYFPFVEPGAEVDISCTLCKGAKQPSNCPVCKGSGWLEMLGAGMVHPNVFKAVGYDPEEVTGFAFGMGIERIAMVRYGISDMRLFYENHLDFLSQF